MGCHFPSCFLAASAFPMMINSRIDLRFSPVPLPPISKRRARNLTAISRRTHAAVRESVGEIFSLMWRMRREVLRAFSSALVLPPLGRFSEYHSVNPGVYVSVYCPGEAFICCRGFLFSFFSFFPFFVSLR